MATKFHGEKGFVKTILCPWFQNSSQTNTRDPPWKRLLSACFRKEEPVYCFFSWSGNQLARSGHNGSCGAVGGRGGGAGKEETKVKFSELTINAMWRVFTGFFNLLSWPKCSHNPISPIVILSVSHPETPGCLNLTYWGASMRCLWVRFFTKIQIRIFNPKTDISFLY